jgi:hypothetical protein
MRSRVARERSLHCDRHVWIERLGNHASGDAIRRSTIASRVGRSVGF